MMKTQHFHGITSLILVLLATLMGLVVMTLNSWILGIIYLAVMVITPQAILHTYCAKCPCKAHCGHVFPGKAAMAFEKEAGPYTLAELTIMLVSVLLLLGLPQFWLWQYPFLLATFWVLTGIALVQIRLTMCPNCHNVYCPLRVRVGQKG